MYQTIDAPAPADGSAPEIPEPPVRADGERWAFVCGHGNGLTVADTRTEIVAQVIGDDYPTDDPDEALVSRYGAAVRVASSYQLTLLVRAAEQGTFDPAEMASRRPFGEDMVNIVMRDRTVAVSAGELPFDDDGAPTWDDPSLPLVLVATDYGPATDRPRPTGNVAWVDPSTETTFLDSLVAARWIVMLTDATPGRYEPDLV